MTDQEINEAVAKKLGWVPNPNPTYRRDFERPWHNPLGIHSFLPDYCHSIEAAWEIAEKMGAQFNLCRDWDTSSWLIRLTDGAFRMGVPEPKFEILEADTAPMAICLAFLVLGSDKGEVNS